MLSKERQSERERERVETQIAYEHKVLILKPNFRTFQIVCYGLNLPREFYNDSSARFMKVFEFVVEYERIDKATPRRALLEYSSRS